MCRTVENKQPLDKGKLRLHVLDSMWSIRDISAATSPFSIFIAFLLDTEFLEVYYIPRVKTAVCSFFSAL